MKLQTGKLQADVDFFEENHERELHELRSKLEEKDKTNFDQSSLITELNKKYITLVEETSSIRIETEAEKAERAKLEKKVKAQAMSQTGILKRNKDLIKQNSELSTKLATSFFEKNLLKNKMDDLEKELTKAKVQIEETQDTCDILINEKEQISSLFQVKVRSSLFIQEFLDFFREVY